jgi:hypothetical protein
VARVGSGVGHTWHGSGSESSVSIERSRGGVRRLFFVKSGSSVGCRGQWKLQ